MIRGWLYFNSRPRGKAISIDAVLLHGGKISIHALAGRRSGQKSGIPRLEIFQFTPSREGDPRNAAVFGTDENFNSRPRGKAIRKNGHNTSSIFPYLPQSVVIKAGRTQKSRYLTWNMRAKNARYLRVPTRIFCAGKVRAFRESRVVQPPP